MPAARPASAGLMPSSALAMDSIRRIVRRRGSFLARRLSSDGFATSVLISKPYAITAFRHGTRAMNHILNNGNTHIESRQKRGGMTVGATQAPDRARCNERIKGGCGWRAVATANCEIRAMLNQIGRVS